ncbi:MAG: alpha/beta hydrolase [Ruminococcaceae bacterium]|nr:alpha/beta hydrolase [Oscillospiraceae bacterium]
MDIKLNYIEKGRGDVLILLHGNGEDCSYFEHQIDYFSEFYRVIAIDTRGHGKSARGNKPFTIRQFAEDLYDFMCEHDIEKAHILGFSDGGNIALYFALKHSDMINRLILNGANLNPSGVKARVQLPIVIGYNFVRLFKNKSEEALRNYELLSLMVNEPDISPEELSAIKNRTLVIAGSNDMIKESHSRLIAESLPEGELIILDGDHFIANKNYTQFNKTVSDFLLR